MVTRNNDLLMLALSRFFSNSEHVNQFVQVTEGKSPVSLRLLDYFVTNYAKQHKTQINDTVLCVHASYRSQLKAFSKQQFDPFRRRERIIFELGDDRSIETTVGQLNFFRWAIESGVLNHVITNKERIEADMYASNAGCAEKPSDDEEGSTDVQHAAKPVEKHRSVPASHLHVTEFQVPLKISFD